MPNDPNATVGDLEDRLLDQKGPLQNHFCSPILNFYAETSRELRRDMQICQLSEEFCIHESAAGIWLEKCPDTGKFLEAMRYSKFHPASPNFEINWTAQFVPTVPPREALRLVKEVDLARFVATSMVTTDRRLPPIIAQFSSDFDVFGHDWPWPISEDPDMQHYLQTFGQMHPGLEWQLLSRLLRFWEWDVPPIDEQEPEEFQRLQADERLQMVHVQLRLSCCNVAEVQGPLNEICAKILAELLGYELKVLKFENPSDFDAAIEGFDQESGGEIEPRRFLLLVKNLPAACRGNFCGPHRMILCYDPAMEPLAKRPRYRLTVKSPAHCTGDC
eukprot:Skav206535  [mRNA]  locus=scaffold504:140497:141651:+ [translate_table: standard]